MGVQRHGAQLGSTALGQLNGLVYAYTSYSDEFTHNTTYMLFKDAAQRRSLLSAHQWHNQ